VMKRKSIPIVIGSPKRRNRNPGSEGDTNGILASEVAVGRSAAYALRLTEQPPAGQSQDH
jgi:hypothetical protein